MSEDLGASLARLNAEFANTGRIDSFKVLRRMKLHERYGEAAEDYESGVVAIVDTETTGLNPDQDAPIELAIQQMQYVARSGSSPARLVMPIASYQCYIDPGFPIPAAISELTGITDSTVVGQRADMNAINGMIASCDAVIAHNAGFDRRVLERINPVFAEMCWGCSVKQVDWAAQGIRNARQDYIAFRRGYFYDAHRALDDCKALAHLLAEPIPGAEGATAFGELMDRIVHPGWRIAAAGAPFAAKDLLKARGYVWRAERREWTTDLATEEGVPAELDWLAGEVFKSSAARDSIPVHALSSLDLFSSRET